MKNRILLFVVALMAAFMTVQAEDYRVYFDNQAVQVTDANKDNLTAVLTEAGLLTAGTVTFSADGSTRKLTLSGAKLKTLDGSWYSMLRISEDLTLEVVGENEILFDVKTGWGYPLYCGSNTKVTLTGSGSLTCRTLLSSLFIGTYICEGATLVIDGNATLVTTGAQHGIYGDTGGKLFVNFGTLKASCYNQWGRADIEVLGGIQLADGVSITQPAGARISDGGVLVVYADGAPIPTNVEVVITGGSASGIATPITSPQDSGGRYNLQGQRVDEAYRGVVIENGRKRVVKK